HPSLPAFPTRRSSDLLNQRVEAHNPFVSESVWKANGGDPVESLKGLTVHCGLDLSETSDLTAFVMVGVDGDGIWHVKPVFWLPSDRKSTRLNSSHVKI